MNLFKRIILIWLTVLSLFFLSFLFPHDEVDAFSVISYSMQLLLFIITLHMIRFEPTRKNKFIFINFAFFFGLSIPAHLYSFVDPSAKVYVAQYVLFGAYFLFVTLAIAYITIDALFREFQIIQKYLLALVVVGGFFGYYYHPILVNPRYLYETEDIQDWKVLDKAVSDYRVTHGSDPSPEALAEIVEINSWKNGQATGTLYPSEKLARINQLHPYLDGSNYLILMCKPIYMNSIYMCVLSLGFILLFFGYQYMKDPPQGAYIDKIMFMFLIFCSMEIMHAWSFVKSLEWRTFYDMIGIGQYLSIVVFCFIALFFGLRLRFITSVKGEFYEQEIATSPYAVTRWRDWLDNLVIAHFFNRKVLSGRLFVDAKRNS